MCMIKFPAELALVAAREAASDLNQIIADHRARFQRKISTSGAAPGIRHVDTSTDFLFQLKAVNNIISLCVPFKGVLSGYHDLFLTAEEFNILRPYLDLSESE